MASIRKRKFGPNKEQEVWIVDYRDQHGKRHLKTFPNKKAAEMWKVNDSTKSNKAPTLPPARA